MYLDTTMTDKRKDAMLTKTDRAFLKESGNYYTGENAKQQRYERRTNIKERVTASLVDFEDLFNADEAERKRVFGDYDRPHRDSFKNQKVREGVINALAFLLRESGVTACMGRSGHGLHNPLFKQVMLEALRRVGVEEGYLVTDFDHNCIEAQRMPSRQLKQKLERGEELSAEEVRYLMEQEDMKNEVQEQLRKRILDG